MTDYSDDEIEVVLAHEFWHHVHRDTWKTITYEAIAVTLACGVVHLTLEWIGPSVGVSSNADVAGLPLAVLAIGAVAILIIPVMNSISRHHERLADQYAIKTTGNPGAFASGLRRLAEQRPSLFVEWLFFSHPPLSDRLNTVRVIR